MRSLTEVQTIQAHGSLHAKNLYVHDHRIVGQPLLITQKVQKKLRQLKSTFDYYAPEMKENIIQLDNLFKLSFQKMDFWSFGFILHKVNANKLLFFDPTRKAILSKSLFSPGMIDLIYRWPSLKPGNHPSWAEINPNDSQILIAVQQVGQTSKKRKQKAGNQQIDAF